MTMLFCIAESEIKVIHTYIHTYMCCTAVRMYVCCTALRMYVCCTALRMYVCCTALRMYVCCTALRMYVWHVFVNERSVKYIFTVKP